MKKEDKTLMIDKIKETLDKYSVIYLANTTSLNAEKTVDLRRAAFKAGIKMMVVKNTLLKKGHVRRVSPLKKTIASGDFFSRSYLSW